MAETGNYLKGEIIMPDANRFPSQQQEESMVRQYIRVLSEELSKGRDGAASRMVYHSQLGLVMAAEAKFARQYGWDVYHRV